MPDVWLADAADAVVAVVAVADAVADVALVESVDASLLELAGGGPLGGGGGVPPADWLCSAANRLWRKDDTASLASLVDDVDAVDASVPLLDAVLDVDDVAPVESSVMPIDANALWIADAKRLRPFVDVDVDDESLVVAPTADVEGVAKSCAMELIPELLLMAEMDMTVLS